MNYSDNEMNYLDKYLLKDKVKFIRKIRCSVCEFRLCEINNKQTCLWCFNDRKLIKYDITYGKYKFAKSLP